MAADKAFGDNSFAAGGVASSHLLGDVPWSWELDIVLSLSKYRDKLPALDLR